jgi:hypothetical protein
VAIFRRGGSGVENLSICEDSGEALTVVMFRRERPNVENLSVLEVGYLSDTVLLVDLVNGILSGINIPVVKQILSKPLKIPALSWMVAESR